MQGIYCMYMDTCNACNTYTGYVLTSMALWGYADTHNGVIIWTPVWMQANPIIEDMGSWCYYGVIQHIMVYTYMQYAGHILYVYGYI